MEREAELSKTDRTLEFVIAAIHDQAHLVKSKWVVEEVWKRKLGLTALYLATGPEVSRSTIAKVYGDTFGHTRAIISWSIRSALINLHQNSSEETKQKFPLREILAPNLRKERPKKLRAERFSYDWLAKSLADAEDDETINLLFKRVSDKFLAKYRREPNPLLLSVGRAARKLGFHFFGPDTQLFVDALEKAGVPVRHLEVIINKSSLEVINYYIILAKHQERAGEVWFADSKLQVFKGNPVRKLCGPGNYVPTFYEILSHKETYSSIKHLFIETGVPFGLRNGLNTDIFFANDCPLTVYRFRARVFYIKSEEEQLREFIKSRAMELSAA